MAGRYGARRLSPEDRRTYTADRIRSGLHQIRLTFVVFIFLYGLFAILDHFLVGEHLPTFLFIRFGIVIPLLIVFIALSYHPSLHKFAQPLMVLCFITGGTGIAYMLILYPENFSYYGGIFMVILAGYFLIKLDTPHALFGGLFTLFLYVAGYAWQYGALNMEALLVVVFFLGANIIGALGNYQMDRIGQANFLHKREIHRQNEQLQDRVREQKTELLQIEKAIDSTSDAVVICNPQGVATYCNAAYKLLMHPLSFPDTRVPHLFEDILADVLTGKSWKGERAVSDDMGVMKVLLVQADVVHEENGNIAGIVTTCRDITERTLAEEALQRSEEKFRQIITTVREGIVSLDAEWRITFANAHLAEMLGYELDELLGQSFEVFLHEEDLVDFARRKDEREQGQYSQFERRFRTKDGREIWAIVSASAMFDNKGSFAGSFGTITDITERKQDEKALRESEDTFRNIVQASPMGIHLYQLQNDDRLVFVGTNPAADKLLGVDNTKFIGMTLEEAFPPLKHTEIATRYRRAAQLGESWHTEQIDYDHDKIAGAFEVYAFQMSLGKVAVLFNDITERKIAENERERLQMQLTQSQKMEAVGQLAGGVAHDFNNMLGVIIGYSELVLEQLDPSQQFHAELEEILKAARRSADLTRQLLTFARKQTVAPRILNLNQTIEGMLNMLRRLIGENINLIWMPGNGLWPIKMDPSQIDQILANLCVNARDAIAGVGKLTVETKNVTFDKEYCATHAGSLPGEYVRITVSDTGSGMDKETLAHIFEPFFTTKGVGEGTGLGLATLYGAVKQNNGFINAYSEPGQGTTFTIYLPRYVEKTTPAQPTVSAKPVVRGDEIIMLVEDEPTLLEMSKTMLERLGYTILAAGTPSEAIRLAGEYSGQIHLLATDVIMPEMNGRELAERLGTSRPEMKCLFMSGYTANIIANQGVLKEGMSFIQKPFAKNELANKVRNALES